MSYPNTMQFVSADSTAITISLPLRGYGCEIHMPIIIAGKHPFGYAEPFDMDSAGSFDYRILTTCKLQLPASQKKALNEFLKNESYGRTENFTLRLGSIPTGFFPFGPDLGDVGDFTVRLLTQQQGGMLLAPLRYWQDDISLVLVSAPSYTPPAGVGQGSFIVGTVDGLLYPQNTFNPVSQYNFSTALSRSGVPSSMDGADSSNSYESTWDQQCNTGKAAELLAMLTGPLGRSKTISIIGAKDFYVYGSDKFSAGIYFSKFLGSSKTKNEIVISATCEGYNQWTMPLSFWLKRAIENTGETIEVEDTFELTETLEL